MMSKENKIRLSCFFQLFIDLFNKMPNLIIDISCTYLFYREFRCPLVGTGHADHSGCLYILLTLVGGLTTYDN
jgi:hypothetical protein